MIASDLASRFGLAPSSGISFFSSGGRDVLCQIGAAYAVLCGPILSASSERQSPSMRQPSLLTGSSSG